MYLVPTNNIDLSNNHLALLRQQQFQQVTEEQYLFAQQQQQQQSLLQQQQEQASTRLHFPVSPSFSPVSPLASPSSASTLPSSLLVPSPPNSPMTSPFGASNIPPTTTVPTLGKPNRACASCKKRKVKCDRKTPSCTACQKSKLRCFYTSYSPSTFSEKHTMTASSLQQQHHDLSEQQDDDVDDEEEEEEEKEKEMETIMIMFKALQDRIEHIEKVCTELQQQQQEQQRLQYYLNNQYPYLLPDDDAALLRLNFANPKVPKTPLRNSASTSPSQAPPQLILRNNIRRSQSPTSLGDSLIPNQHPHSFNPYPLHSPQKSVFNNSVLSAQQVTLLPIKRAIITFNYKSSGLRQLLGRAVVPMLSTTTGRGPQIPVSGFQDPYQMQSWFSQKIQALLDMFNTTDHHYLAENFGNIFDPNERFQLRPLSINANPLSPHQQFEIVLCRVVRQSEAVQSLTSSLPGLYDEEMDGSFEYEAAEESEMNTKSSITPNIFTSNSTTGPPRQLIDSSNDVFLNKVYGLIRFFISHLPWAQGAAVNEINCWSEGLFSDVIVEIVSNSTNSPSG